MYSTIIKNDMKASPFISLTIFAFILFASFLMTTVTIVAVNLTASINLSMEKSQAPHFLQMHKGPFDEDRMAHFAQTNPHVEAYQTIPFLNVDASDILINGQPFTESTQDNGFSYQGGSFDYLLDLDGRIAYPNPGEVYVPLPYYIQGIIEEGDTISFAGLDFQVMGPIRDAQMSSMLSSSKRFLIHPADYDKIKGHGQEEFLIEFLLKDPFTVDRFQGDYAQAGLESNGPTISLAIIKLINALTDGIMIAILSLIACLILLVSFLCIRLTLAAKIDDEYKTIGVLKALGLRLSQIKKIYQGKYAVVSVLACLLGLVLSFIFSDLFLKNIKVFFGSHDSGWAVFFFAIIANILLFFLVMAYISFFLRRLKKVSAAQAINMGRVSPSASKLDHFKLRQQSLLLRDAFLAFNLILTRKKTYLTFLIILIIASFVMVLPNNIYSSFASDQFIAYLGFGDYQGMMIFSGEDDLEEYPSHLEKDSDIESYAVYDQKSYEFLLDDGSTSKMWVSLGDHEQFPVYYTQGRPPSHDQEIGLSYLNASSLDKEVGDSLSLIIQDEKKDFTVSGIYSDTTNGGKTAQANFIDNQTPSLTTRLVMTFREGLDINEKLHSLQQTYPEAKVYHVQDYRKAVFGSTLTSMKIAGITSMILAVGLSFFITLLFVNMLVIKDRHSLAILKSLGFTSAALKKIYMMGSILLVGISIVLGLVLANTLGQSLAGLFIQSMGIANFRFFIDKVFVILVTPISMLVSVMIGTHLATQSIHKLKVSDAIRG